MERRTLIKSVGGLAATRSMVGTVAASNDDNLSEEVVLQLLSKGKTEALKQRGASVNKIPAIAVNPPQRGSDGVSTQKVYDKDDSNLYAAAYDDGGTLKVTGTMNFGSNMNEFLGGGTRYCNDVLGMVCNGDHYSLADPPSLEVWNDEGLGVSKPTNMTRTRQAYLRRLILRWLRTGEITITQTIRGLR